MIEVFAGGAVLTSVAKQFGLNGLAIDKVKKTNARSTIFQLDLMQQSDRELLEQWLYVTFAVMGAFCTSVWNGKPST